MGQINLRCQYCGAKNTDDMAERCRICSGVLPGAAVRRRNATQAGATFTTLVEGELETWRLYKEGSPVPGDGSTPKPAPASYTDPVPHNEPAKRGMRRLFRS
jgi:hypothetical protein